jgi:hypothetical protein
MSDARPSFPVACRRFLALLDELANDPRRTDEHVAGCRSCALRLSAARLQVQALRRLERPALPDGFDDAAMLAGIYERSTAALEVDLAQPLRQGLAGVRAPADVAWFEDGVRGDLELRLRRGLTRTRSPGWMWRRIRQTVRPETPRTMPRLAARIALVAAALLVGVLVFQPTRLWRDGSQGTYPVLVVVDEPSPLDPSYSFSGLAEVVR